MEPVEGLPISACGNLAYGPALKKSNTDFWDTLYVDCRYIYKYEIILLKLDIFNFHVDTISDRRSVDGTELQVAPHPAAGIEMMHHGTRAAPPQLAT